MTRFAVLATLVAAGALSIAVAAAEQPSANAPKVVTVDKVKDRLWVLKGEGGGGNVAVFETAKGIVVVDAKNPGWGQPILDKIKELSNKPVTVLINTHTHGDHVSGNVDFPATVDIVTQENTKANMEKMDIFKQNGGQGSAQAHFQGQDVDHEAGPIRSISITLVLVTRMATRSSSSTRYARRTQAICLAGKSLPLVDGNNGGSVRRYPETLTKVDNGIKNVDTVITGHAPTTMVWADVKEFASFTQDFLTWAQAALKPVRRRKRPRWNGRCRSVIRVTRHRSVR